MAVNPGLTQKTGRMTSTGAYWKWKDGKYKSARKSEKKKVDLAYQIPVLMTYVG